MRTIIILFVLITILTSAVTGGVVYYSQLNIVNNLTTQHQADLDKLNQQIQDLQAQLADIENVASNDNLNVAPTIPAVDPYEGWLTYTNSKYGYTIKYPEGVQFIDKDSKCTGLWYKVGDKILGTVTIGAPAVYGDICGRTGYGYDITAISENIFIGENKYDFSGYVEKGPGETLQYHNETLSIHLADKTKIEFGSGNDSTTTYDYYVTNIKPILIKMVESFEQQKIQTPSSATSDQIGYITSIDNVNGKYYVNIDYVVLFNRGSKEGLQAMIEDGICKSEEDCDIHPGTYIRNNNPLIRKFELLNTEDLNMDSYVFRDNKYTVRCNETAPVFRKVSIEELNTYVKYLNQQNDQITYFMIKLNSDNKIIMVDENTWCLP